MAQTINKAKARLKNGELAIGCGIRLVRNVDIIKIMKSAGFDWMFIDCEHGSTSIETACELSVAAQDSGAPGLSTYQTPSTDAVGEVKLLTGNYSAEYGARNGGQLNVTIKNGTGQFHGSAYYYYRHEEFNANEFFNNELNVQKPRYRYENPGGTVGGPLLIPGVRFNRNRNRLFFFLSYAEVLTPQSGSYQTLVLTPAAQTGNFTYVGTDGASHTVNLLSLAGQNGFPSTCRGAVSFCCPKRRTPRLEAGMPIGP